MAFSLTDVVSISDFSREDIEAVLKKAAEMEKTPPEKKKNVLENKTVAVLFFEPSTRTRLSFETAAQNLGGKIIGFADAGVSSTAKGESLSHTIRVVSGYADMIVMRHSIEGAARRAAEVSDKPVINGGDGANQHPTQTLLDLYTIQKEFKKIDGINIGLLGDLKYGRTVHSLMYALANFKGVKVYCIAPESLRMPASIIDDTADKLQIKETSKLQEFLPKLDVLYATRIQKERFVDEFEYEQIKNVFVLGKEILRNAKKGFKLMHPLPIVNEIKPELDDSEAALYFQQAKNGIPVREALLAMLRDVKKK
ncbi:MAG: aspartate carbamoyltransferase [Candidatus Diapherotrites archaeon]|nr:aspartate carbamoyltransferase [Candidatus Diapherotrites archaeon]